jgi:hypothetical protein
MVRPILIALVSAMRAFLCLDDGRHSVEILNRFSSRQHFV